MKRILLFITLLPLIALAQVQQPPTTGGYNVSSSQVTLYRNGTGIDANLRLFGGSLYGYFDVPTLRKVYTRAQIDSIANTAIRKKLRIETNEKNLNNYIQPGSWDIYPNDGAFWQNVPSGIGYGVLTVSRSQFGVLQLISGINDDGGGNVVRSLYWRTSYAPGGGVDASFTGIPWIEIKQGGVSSVTRGLGFQNSGTSITSSGTLDIDTINGVLGKTAANTRYSYLLGRFTNADNIYYRKTGGTLTGDATIEYNGTPSFNLSNNVSGSKTTFSQSPTNNEFSISVSTLPAGGIGGALSTSSASSQSISKTNVIPIGASPFSIVGWFQRTGGTNQVVYTNGSTASANQINLTLNSSGNYVLSHSGTSLGGGNTVGSQWVHVAYTFTGTTGKLFINGVIQGGAQTITSPNLGSSTLIIGRSALNAQFADYNTDQFIVATIAYTDAQVLAIYNNGLGTPSIPTAGLAARFDFETSGNLLLDAVTGTNATATNSPTFNPNGKVAVATSGGLAAHKSISIQNGDSNGENVVVNVGEKDFTNTLRLLGRLNIIQDVNGISSIKGANGQFRTGYGMSLNLDVNANTALYGHYWEPGNTTNIGMWQFGAATTLPTPSAAKIGVHTWDGSRLDVITSATGRSKYAYTSDLTQIVEIANGTTTQQASANTIYIPHGTSKTTITLPLDANAPVGTLIQVVGEGSGGWRIGQNASQFIVGIGTFSTTVGTAGYVESSEANCTITLRKTLTNKWTITSSQGTINRN